MKKLVVLDFTIKRTLVIPYDTNVFESPEECISNYNEELNDPIILSNCCFMEVPFFELKII
jgi:hypothetical protein